MFVLPATQAHWLAATVSHHADNKFFGLADIAERVLWFSVDGVVVLRHAQAWGKCEQRWIHGDAVEEGNGSKIGLSGRTERGHPRNGSRNNGTQKNAIELTIREL